MTGERTELPHESANRELLKALAAFHLDLQKVKVTKTGKNPHFNSDYATLVDILSVVMPSLASHGLTWIQSPGANNSLVSELEHGGGGYKRIIRPW